MPEKITPAKRTFNKLSGAIFLTFVLPLSSNVVFSATSANETEDASPVSATVYSCQLSAQSNQCREYAISESANQKKITLKESCQSMGGEFTESLCTAKERASRCMNVVRGPVQLKEVWLKMNFDNPKAVLYDNHYYLRGEEGWTPEMTQQVCRDLGGIYEDG